MLNASLDKTFPSPVPLTGQEKRRGWDEREKNPALAGKREYKQSDRGR